MLCYLTSLHKTGFLLQFFFTLLGVNMFGSCLKKKTTTFISFSVKHKGFKNFQSHLTSHLATTIILYTKLEREKENCRKACFLLSPCHSPHSAETDEERPIQELQLKHQVQR